MPQDNWLKMKDLVAATGVSKSTALFYVQEGLLPRPEKTHRNMAYYHPDCVERIRFIKELQEERQLPLKAIKGLLRIRDQGEDPTPLLALQEKLFGRRDRRRMDAREFRRHTGLTAAQMKRAVAAGVILPLEDGRFDSLDVDMGRVVLQAIGRGIAPEEWADLYELGQPLADLALSLRNRHTMHLPHDEDAALTGEIADMYRALMPYVCDRIIQRRMIVLKGLKDPTLRPESGAKKHSPTPGALAPGNTDCGGG